MFTFALFWHRPRTTDIFRQIVHADFVGSERQQGQNLSIESALFTLAVCSLTLLLLAIVHLHQKDSLLKQALRRICADVLTHHTRSSLHFPSYTKLGCRFLARPMSLSHFISSILCVGHFLIIGCSEAHPGRMREKYVFLVLQS